MSRGAPERKGREEEGGEESLQDFNQTASAWKTSQHETVKFRSYKRGCDAARFLSLIVNICNYLNDLQE
jgi:hypothetical protein